MVGKVGQQAGEADVVRDYFANRVGEARHWIDTAEELVAAAAIFEEPIARWWKAMREGIDAVPPRPPFELHLMLMAYGLENYLKAVIVSRRPWHYRLEAYKTRRLPQVLNGHKLVELAKTARLALDSTEEDLLRRLTRAAVWAGRYPVPLSAVPDCTEYSDGKQYSLSWFGGADAENLAAFCARIRDILGLDHAAPLDTTGVAGPADPTT
jgi:hypothetical protein